MGRTVGSAEVYHEIEYGNGKQYALRDKAGRVLGEYRNRFAARLRARELGHGFEVFDTLAKKVID